MIYDVLTLFLYDIIYSTVLYTEGVRVTSSESIIYELLQDAKHEKFKAALAIVKELAKHKASQSIAEHT